MLAYTLTDATLNFVERKRGNLYLFYDRMEFHSSDHNFSCFVHLCSNYSAKILCCHSHQLAACKLKGSKQEK